MAEPFLAEIKIVSFNFAPRGWAFCNGQTLPINQNQALFSLLGTTYGGNGQTTFALPNLQGRTPIHFGASDGANPHTLGQAGGEQAHTLALQEMPLHQHVAQGTNVEATSAIPSSTMLLANSKNYEAYRPASNPVSLQAGTIASVGGSLPHENMQPYLSLSFCIALRGLFPSRN